jgi:hypothetical protein
MAAKSVTGFRQHGKLNKLGEWKMKKRLGGSIVEVHELPLSEIAELRSTISDLEGAIEAKRAELARVQVQLRHAGHDLKLHRSFHGSGNSPVILSDEARIEDLQLQRSQLSNDLGALTKRLPVLTHQVDEVIRKGAKETAAAGEAEIRISAKKMLDAVENARQAVEDYKAIRQSFARPLQHWPFWYAPLVGKKVDLWISDVRRFIKSK